MRIILVLSLAVLVLGIGAFVNVPEGQCYGGGCKPPNSLCSPYGYAPCGTPEGISGTCGLSCVEIKDA